MSFAEKLGFRKKGSNEYSMTQWNNKLKASSGDKVDFHEDLTASREGKNVSKN